MMNLSELLTSVKMKLGIYGLSLPIENLDQTLYDVIKLESLKTFSQYFPHRIHLEMPMEDLETIKDGYVHTIVRLPDVFGDRRILFVEDVTHGDVHRSTGGYLAPEIEGSMDVFGMMMMGHAVSHMNSAISPPVTFKFEAPNKLHLYNFKSHATKIIIVVCVEHFENLTSIPATSMESFRELVILDIKSFLYGIVKHYTDIQTAHGTINLKIDDWADAESKRAEIIEKWKSVHHLEGRQFIIV